METLGYVLPMSCPLLHGNENVAAGAAKELIELLCVVTTASTGALYIETTKFTHKVRLPRRVYVGTGKQVTCWIVVPRLVEMVLSGALSSPKNKWMVSKFLASAAPHTSGERILRCDVCFPTT